MYRNYQRMSHEMDFDQLIELLEDERRKSTVKENHLIHITNGKRKIKTRQKRISVICHDHLDRIRPSL